MNSSCFDYMVRSLFFFSFCVQYSLLADNCVSGFGIHQPILIWLLGIYWKSVVTLMAMLPISIHQHRMAQFSCGFGNLLIIFTFCFLNIFYENFIHVHNGFWSHLISLPNSTQIVSHIPSQLHVLLVFITNGVQLVLLLETGSSLGVNNLPGATALSTSIAVQLGVGVQSALPRQRAFKLRGHLLWRSLLNMVLKTDFEKTLQQSIPNISRCWSVICCAFTTQSLNSLAMKL